MILATRRALYTENTTYMSALLVLSSDQFWGIYDPILQIYEMAAIDIGCPSHIVATSQSGDRYQIKTGEHAMQMHLIGLSDIRLPTQKL
jgi:hypothetical protein